MNNNIDFYAKQANETSAEHKDRIRKHESAKFEERKRAMEANKSTFLPYDEKMLKMQIVEMTNSITDNYYNDAGERIKQCTADEREIYQMRFSHLYEMSKALFNQIIEGQMPNPAEIKYITKFHKLITEGKMTKYAASAAYSEYRITQLINKGKNSSTGSTSNDGAEIVNEQKNKNFDNSWEIMRTKNAFADQSIYD